MTDRTIGETPKSQTDTRPKRSEAFVTLTLVGLFLATSYLVGVIPAIFGKTFSNRSPNASPDLISNLPDGAINTRIILAVLLTVGLVVALSGLWPRAKGVLTSVRPIHGLLLVGIAVVLLAVYFRGSLADDTWIYVRVSDMVRATGLPKWNIDDGFSPSTSFTWPYALALFGSAEVKLMLAGTLSIVLLLAAGAFTYVKLGKSWEAVLAATASILSAPLTYWGVVGMETALSVSGVVVFSVLLLKSPSSIWTWICGGALIFIRPDLVLIPLFACILVLVWLMGLARNEAKQADGLRTPMRDTRTRSLLAFPLLVLLYLAANFVFFERPLPTPLYFKGSLSETSGSKTDLANFVDGLSEAVGAISQNFALAFGIIMCCVLFLHRRRSYRAPLFKDANHVALVVASVALLLLNVTWGYQHMGYGFRYFLPALAALAVGVIGPVALRREMEMANAEPQRLEPGGVGTGPDAKRCSEFEAASTGIRVVLMAVVSAWMVAIFFSSINVGLGFASLRDWFSARAYTAFLETYFVPNGRLIASYAEPGDNLYVYTQIQAMGFVSQANAYEAWYAPAYLSSVDEIRNCALSEYAPEVATSFLGYPALPGSKSGQAGYWPSIDCLGNFDWVVAAPGSGAPVEDPSFLEKFKKIEGDLWGNRELLSSNS